MLAVDPYLRGTVEGVRLVSLEEALSLADIITIHSSGENCILRKKEFAIMKKGIFLLNAARGNAIDEDALLDGLEKEIIRGAWIDVFKNQYLIILIDNICRNISGNDFAKKAVTHGYFPSGLVTYYGLLFLQCLTGQSGVTIHRVRHQGQDHDGITSPDYETINQQFRK